MADEVKKVTLSKKQLEDFVSKSVEKGLTGDQIREYVQQNVNYDPTFFERHPNVAAGARGVLDTLPAVGGMFAGAAAGVPGAVTGPGDLALVAGAAGLGAGIGRGARDLIAEGVGLEEPTSPLSKAARIGVDTAVSGATTAAGPALMDAVKRPGETVADILESIAHPQRQIGEVADMLRGKMAPPSPVLTRPPTPIRIAPEPPIPGSTYQTLPKAETPGPVPLNRGGHVVGTEGIGPDGKPFIPTMVSPDTAPPVNMGRPVATPAPGVGGPESWRRFGQMRGTPAPGVTPPPPSTGGAQSWRNLPAMAGTPAPSPEESLVDHYMPNVSTFKAGDVPTPDVEREMILNRLEQGAVPDEAAPATQSTKKVSVQEVPPSKSKRTPMSATPGLTINDMDAIDIKPNLKVKGLSKDAIRRILTSRAARSGLYRTQAELDALVKAQMDKIAEE